MLVEETKVYLMAVKSRVTFLELVKAVRLSNSQYFEVEVQARFLR